MTKQFLFLIFWLFATAPIFAHQSALSYLELKTNTNNSIEVMIKKPLQDMNSDDINIEFPRYCRDILPVVRFEKDRFILLKRSLWCGQKGLNGSIIKITNLLQTDKGVIFRYEDEQKRMENRLITAKEPYVLIQENRTNNRTSYAYLWLGVEHILSGFDHLLFVLALLLIVSNIKVLIQTVTAFTIAHSITLGFAVLGFIDFSVPYIEMMIALSIIFLARELLINLEEKTLTYTYPWIIAFMFGLLHGLGFASSLFEVGLPPENITSSLLFFNLGVELGQLMFIFSVLVMIWLLKKVILKHHEFIRKITAYFIGITSAYWFIQRSIIFF